MFASLLITRSRRYHPYRRRTSGHGCPRGLSTVIDFASLAAEGSYTTNSEQEMRRPRSISSVGMRYFCTNANDTIAICKKNAEMHSQSPLNTSISNDTPNDMVRAKYCTNLNILYTCTYWSHESKLAV